MASRLQDVIQRGLASAKPLATAVAIGTLYYSTDTQVTERSDGTTWQSYNDAGTGATLPIDLTTDVAGILPAANIGPHASTHNAGGSDPITITTAQLPAHHTTHEAGGTDPIQLDNLAGPDDNVDLNASTTAHGLLPKLTGNASQYLDGSGGWSAPSVVIPVVRRQVTLTIDNGASVIITGQKGYISLPSAGTWKKWRLLSTISGSIVIDVWKAPYSGYPPVVGNTITGTDKPTISSTNKNESVALTGWNTSFAAGDILGFNVDSVATVTKVVLALEFE